MQQAISWTDGDSSMMPYGVTKPQWDDDNK